MSRTVLFNLFSDYLKKNNFRSRYKPNKEIIFFMLSIPHIGEKKSFATGKLFLLTFNSWGQVYSLHMPQFSAFEVYVENVCCIPWCPSTHWELGLCEEVWPRVSPTWPRGTRWTGYVMSAPGGLRFNNASCPALAGTTLWSVPETSVAWVFNHLACTSLLPINPSPLLHSPHPHAHPLSLHTN